jgi:cytochrome c oxidase subunit 3
MSTVRQFIDKTEKTHHYKVMLTIALFGIGLLFLTLLFIFYTRIQKEVLEIVIPKAFGVSTLLLLWNSYRLMSVLNYYQQEELLRLQKRIRELLVISSLFIITQSIGWLELWRLGAIGTTKVLIYIITVLHILHLFGGWIFAFVVCREIQNVSKDPVKELIWLKNPFQKLKLELLVMYWHFMDLLWVLLFMLFFFMI